MRISLVSQALLFLAGLLLAACGGTFEVGIEGTLDAGLQTASASRPPLEGALLEETAAASEAAPESTPSLTAAASPSDPATPLPESPSLTPTVCGPPARWVSYTVRSGDTLFSLSQQTNVTVGQLQSANCLKGTTIRVGQQLFLPFVPTPTATATFTPTPTVTVDPQAIWAPAGKRYVTPLGAVVDTETGRVGTITTEVLPWFILWTSDSRFVIFTYINQYDNGRTIVFDTQAWGVILETNGCGLPTAACWEYVVGLDQSAPRILRADGMLYTLPDTRPLDLLAAWRVGKRLIVEKAAKWSPTGSYLAFVVNSENETDFALYAAQGVQVQRVASLDGASQSLQWTGDGKSVTVTTMFSQYTLDVTTGQLQITPLATATPTPLPSATTALTPTPAP